MRHRILVQSCSGFLYAMNNAVGMMELNNWKYALLVGSEILSGIADWKDRSTCVLFGDAAGAVLLEKVDESDLSDSDEKLAGKVGVFVSGSDGTDLQEKKQFKITKKIMPKIHFSRLYLFFSYYIKISVFHHEQEFFLNY